MVGTDYAGVGYYRQEYYATTRISRTHAGYEQPGKNEIGSLEDSENKTPLSGSDLGFKDSTHSLFDDMNTSFLAKTVARPEMQTEDLGMGFLNVGIMGMGMRATMRTDENGDKIVSVNVSTGSGNENYEINLSKVDPRNATAIEMFAFCQYADASGTGVSDKWGSWHALKTFAAPNGYSLEYSSLEEATTQKKDWTSALAKSKTILENESTSETLNAADVLQMLKDTLEERYKEQKEKEDSDDWHDMDDEEWDRLISGIDKYIDSYKDGLEQEEELRKEVGSDLLTARYTTFVRKTSYTDPDSATGEVVNVGYMYRTFYTHDGIISQRSGYSSKDGAMKDRVNWKVDFKNDEDYERTMRLLDRIPEGDNTTFTSKELFWKDFLNGEIDEDEFFAYYDTLDHGIARFIKVDENGNNYVDKEMMDSKFFKYFGILQMRTLSEEELQRGLELSALKDRGYDRSAYNKKEDMD